jgi:hypothetical protein
MSALVSIAGLPGGYLSWWCGLSFPKIMSARSDDAARTRLA